MISLNQYVTEEAKLLKQLYAQERCRNTTLKDSKKITTSDMIRSLTGERLEALFAWYKLQNKLIGEKYEKSNRN